MHFLTQQMMEQSLQQVYQQMLPTPSYSWPQINTAVGTEVWVKHENHTPTGAFKIRGGITFMHWLRQQYPECRGIVTATRGNHGQSQARAARALGLAANIVVPLGNSIEKNQAMSSFGAKLIEYGRDFDEAKVRANTIAQKTGYYLVPPFHQALVSGVATYAWELFQAVPAIDVVYAPIGCGSGICGLIGVRDLLGLTTEIVGVVAAKASAAKLSFESGQLAATESADTFADGLAVRSPIEEAFAIYSNGAGRIVAVTEAEIASAICLYYRGTHNIAEGAGAAALAAALKEKALIAGKKAAIILSGGNIDTAVLQSIFAANQSDYYCA